jgi:hypothetical protein
VVENVVGWGGQAAGVGKDEVGRDEKVREIVDGEVASDGLVVASGAGVFENSLVVAGVDPYSFKCGRAEGGVGCSEVSEVEIRLGG